MEILGPHLVFRISAVERNARGAAIAPVVDQHAMARLGELLPERLDPLQPASSAGLDGHPRDALTEHLVIDLDTADRRLRHGSPPWSVIGNCVILADIPAPRRRIDLRGYAVRLRARTKLARRLRKNATEVENRLWQALRELRTGHRTGHRFRRQHPIGPCVVDFAYPARKLAIEA